ncbi:MAG: hypothetical protein RIC55_17685 [Pirellulaceae bacterium]
MSFRIPSSPRNRAPSHHNASVLARSSRRRAPSGKRSRGSADRAAEPFSPPEDWHEPAEKVSVGYRIIVQEPGDGYEHVVTPDEIRQRLDRLPAFMTEPLEVVQLSRMTRKKQRFPCYGMQWGTALYLYPLETGLVEYFTRPPKPNVITEARMYGGRWKRDSAANIWRLIWTPETIRDFYLNNILIHELGHLLDERNTSYFDRERYAEWFAIEHGYKASRRKDLASQAAKKVVRRHHSKQA